MRVNLTGLTEEQCVILDIMWEQDTREKWLEFIATLSPRTLNTVMTLQEMVIQEISEKDTDIDPDLGKKMLKSIGVNI